MGKPFSQLPTRILKACLGTAMTKAKNAGRYGPFFLLDLPRSLKQALSFEADFGPPALVIEFRVDEWLEPSAHAADIVAEYGERQLVCALDSAQPTKTLVDVVDAHLKVRRQKGLMEEVRCARATTGPPPAAGAAAHDRAKVAT